jgi:hypothetical protein
MVSYIFLAAMFRRSLESRKLKVMTMPKDDRDLLELFKEELDFLEKGGYGRSVRTPWKLTSAFQDSLTCINYGYPYRAHPCDECHLIDFVPSEKRAETIPCHHIPLDPKGETTVETLEVEENQQKLENAVKDWLRARIKQIEEERALRELDFLTAERD